MNHIEFIEKYCRVKQPDGTFSPIIITDKGREFLESLDPDSLPPLKVYKRKVIPKSVQELVDEGIISRPKIFNLTHE
jgi:hypothetical protein